LEVGILVPSKFANPYVDAEECAIRSANDVMVARQRLLRFFAYNRCVPNLRSCLVSFTDTDDIEHSIRVPAESLYEAAIEAMAAFRRGAFAEMTFGSATQLKIRVRAPEEEHTVTVGKVLSWLDGGARSPNEQVKKNRLKERLRR
jgi:hypothetical protein